MKRKRKGPWGVIALLMFVAIGMGTAAVFMYEADRLKQMRVAEEQWDRANSQDRKLKCTYCNGTGITSHVQTGGTVLNEKCSFIFRNLHD